MDWHLNKLFRKYYIDYGIHKFIIRKLQRTYCNSLEPEKAITLKCD